MIATILDQLEVAEDKHLIRKYTVRHFPHRALITIDFFHITQKETISRFIKHMQSRYCAYVERENEYTLILDVDEQRAYTVFARFL